MDHIGTHTLFSENQEISNILQRMVSLPVLIELYHSKNMIYFSRSSPIIDREHKMTRIHSGLWGGPLFTSIYIVYI